MFYLKFDKNTGTILGCINFYDNTLDLLEVSKQQYVDFVEGKVNLHSFQVQKIHDVYCLVEKKAIDNFTVSYKSFVNVKNNADSTIIITKVDNILKITLTDQADIESVTSSWIVFYVTKKNSPHNLLDTITLSVNELLEKRCIEIKISDKINVPISIYTKKNLPMSFEND